MNLRTMPSVAARAALAAAAAAGLDRRRISAAALSAIAAIVGCSSSAPPREDRPTSRGSALAHGGPDVCVPGDPVFGVGGLGATKATARANAQSAALEECVEDCRLPCVITSTTCTELAPSYCGIGSHATTCWGCDAEATVTCQPSVGEACTSTLPCCVNVQAPPTSSLGGPLVCGPMGTCMWLNGGDCSNTPCNPGDSVTGYKCCEKAFPAQCIPSNYVCGDVSGAGADAGGGDAGAGSGGEDAGVAADACVDDQACAKVCQPGPVQSKICTGFTVICPGVMCQNGEQCVDGECNKITIVDSGGADDAERTDDAGGGDDASGTASGGLDDASGGGGGGGGEGDPCGGNSGIDCADGLSCEDGRCVTTILN